MEFSCESISSIWDEALSLARIHWAGTKGFRRHEPFQPVLGRYLAYENARAFRAYTARDGEKLVGYFGIYITPSMHSQRLTATEDTFFIHPDYRDGFNAIRFIKYVERDLFGLGVHEILFSCEIDNTVANKLLTFLRYTPVIQQYRKLLQSSADSAPSDHVEVNDVCAESPTRS